MMQKQQKKPSPKAWFFCVFRLNYLTVSVSPSRPICWFLLDEFPTYTNLTPITPSVKSPAETVVKLGEIVVAVPSTKPTFVGCHVEPSVVYSMVMVVNIFLADHSLRLNVTPAIVPLERETVTYCAVFFDARQGISVMVPVCLLALERTTLNVAWLASTPRSALVIVCSA